jgi:hypothetical protein
MTLRRVVRVTAGLLARRPAASEALLGEPAAVWWGLAVAALAGAARYHDRPDPVPGGWWVVGPLLALFLAALTAWVCFATGVLCGAVETRWRDVLAVVGLSSLPGWLHGVPPEALAGVVEPRAALVGIALVVVAWRVAVLVTAFRVVFGHGPWCRMLAVFTPVTLAGGLAATLFGAMGLYWAAMTGEEGHRDVRPRALTMLAIGVVLAVVLPLTALVAWLRARRAAPVSAPPR